MARSATRFPGHWIDVTPEILSRARIPRRFWDVSVGGVKCELLKTVLGNYLGPPNWMIHKRLDKGDGFLFWGPNGSGKTGGAVAVVREVCRAGGTCLFVTAAGFCQAVITKERFDDECSVWERASSVEMLILDDMGKEPTGNSTWGARSLESLLRSRAANERSTIITTNLSLEGFADMYRQSMAEVLKECCLPVCVDGVNYRDQLGQDLGDRLTNR